MDYPGLVNTKLDLTCLGIGHGLGNVLRHRSYLGVWHQSTRAQHLAELANHPHGAWGCDANIKVNGSTLNRLSKIIESDDICARGLCSFNVVAVGKNRYAHCLAGPFRQYRSAADILV